MCGNFITRLLWGVGRLANKPVNHTSWVAVVNPTDREILNTQDYHYTDLLVILKGIYESGIDILTKNTFTYETFCIP